LYVCAPLYDVEIFDLPPTRHYCVLTYFEDVDTEVCGKWLITFIL